MLRLRAISRAGGLLALAACLNGCIPGDPRVDEEKDPHFQRGITLVNGLDYKGAADEFEKALEENPRSAAAHFELGCLCDSMSNSAAAIYHYERHLELMPNSPHAAMIQQRIHGCKQDLAKSEFLPPNTQNLQRKVDELLVENQSLREKLAAAQRQPGMAQAAVEPSRPAVEPVRLTQAVQNAQALPAARPKTHVVRERETISSIAAQYGIKASAILAANPRIDPRRLHVGQSLQLP